MALRVAIVALMGVVSAGLLCAAGSGGRHAEPRSKVRPDVLAQVETELARLSERADAVADQRTPSVYRAVAYYMLAGLATHAEPLKDVAHAEQTVFGIDSADDRSNGRLLQVADDARIAVVDKRLRDKSGWYTLRFASLFRHRDGAWAKQGWGSTIVD